MEFSEFSARSAATDQEQDPANGLRIALLGLAGEAGSVVAEAKKWFRDHPPEGLSAEVSEELGDLLWYLAAVARRLGLDLDEVALTNLEKTKQMWTQDLGPIRSYDEGYPEAERLPRKMRVRFAEDASGDFPVVRMELLNDSTSQGHGTRLHLGDVLNDNAGSNDGYRYHDVLHLAHATILGWSPVLRSLLGRKRKSAPDVDRTEDGARAMALEEGLSAFVFNWVERTGFLEGASELEWALLRHVSRTVRALEVSSQPPVAWQEAYLQGFAAFRQLHSARGGIVECNLDDRTLTVRHQP